MSLSSLISDPYEREARLAPALIVVMPIAAVVGLLFPEFRVSSGWLIGLLVSCGMLALFRSFIRDQAKKLELQMWDEWGGMPSVARLRHRDRYFDVVEKQSIRNNVALLVPDIQFPSEQEEKVNPQAADLVYRRASNWVLDNTRDTKEFPLVFKENINYGFRRNLLGGKGLALFLDFCLACFWVAVLWMRHIGEQDFAAGIGSVQSTEWLALVFMGAHALFFATQVNKDWVKVSADNFSMQLLRATNSLRAKANK
jgi:hypothetical protein